MDTEDFRKYLSVKVGLTNSTVDAYLVKLVQFSRWLSQNNQTLSASSIESYLFSKNDKPSTVNIYLYLFKHYEAYLKDRGRPIDLTSGFKHRRVERPPIQILSVDEIKKLINTPVIYGKENFVFKEVSRRYTVFTKFLYLTLCRIGEARSLTVGNIDLGGGWVTFTHTKGKKYRRVPIQEPLISDLRPYIIGKGKDELVFQSRNGTPIEVRNYSRELLRRANQLGITTRLHAHLFRHSGASHLVMNGVPIELVSRILGHEDVGLTMSTYVHLKDEQLQNAMFRLPYYRENTHPKEIIKMIITGLKSYKLEDDSRLIYKLEEGTNSLLLTLAVK